MCFCGFFSIKKYMIVTLLLYVLTMFLNMVTVILPSWEVWPTALLDGLTYFLSLLGKLNFILPMDTFMSVLLFLVTFETVYFGTKIIMKVFNFLRGTGSGLDI